MASLPGPSRSKQMIETNLAEYFPTADDGQASRTSYSDAEIESIRSLLIRLNRDWARIPRWYIILRAIGHEGVLDQVIKHGFTDNRLPITESHLPDSISLPIRVQIVAAQQMICTNILELEKDNGRHLTFKKGDVIPYVYLQKYPIGKGSFGKVHRVFSLVSRKEYARKRIERAYFGPTSKPNVSDVGTEVQNLKRVKHRHVVTLIASFTDPKCLNIIMSPVAERNLRSYLDDHFSEKLQGELRGFFGCLVYALHYLHEKAQIRHKDVKPANILVNHGQVYLADFGLALDFSNRSSSTTSGETHCTPKYAAPEVKDPHGRRNISSDIWSLGCVFLEMVAVLKGWRMDRFNNYFFNHGTRYGDFYRNDPAVGQLIQELMNTASQEDNKPLDWTRKMLQVRPTDRPSAVDLVSYIKEPIHMKESILFCGLCCSNPDVSDTSDHSSCIDSGLGNSVQVDRTPSPVNIRLSRVGETPSPALSQQSWVGEMSTLGNIQTSWVRKRPSLESIRVSETSSKIREEFPLEPSPSGIAKAPLPHQSIVHQSDHDPRVFLENEFAALHLTKDKELRLDSPKAVVDTEGRLREIRTKLVEDKEQAVSGYLLCLEAIFGDGPDFPTFDSCPLSKDRIYRQWQDGPRSSVLVLQGNARARTSFSWFAPIMVGLWKVLVEKGEKAIFQCCQVKDGYDHGDEPSSILSSIILQLLESQPDILLSRKLWQHITDLLEGVHWATLDWGSGLKVLSAILGSFERVFIILDRADMMSGDWKRFLEALAKLMTVKTDACVIKLVLVASGRGESESWQRMQTSFAHLLSQDSFWVVTRDENDRDWQYEVNLE